MLIGLSFYLSGEQMSVIVSWFLNHFSVTERNRRIAFFNFQVVDCMLKWWMEQSFINMKTVIVYFLYVESNFWIWKQELRFSMGFALVILNIILE